MTIPVVLVLDTGDADEEHAEEQLHHLIAELSELDLDSIDRVERNTTIPIKRGEVFVTQAKNQTTLVVRILEGEGGRASDNRSLAVLELTDLPRHPKGTPLVEVHLDIDANGTCTSKPRNARSPTQRPHSPAERARPP